MPSSPEEMGILQFLDVDIPQGKDAPGGILLPDSLDNECTIGAATKLSAASALALDPPSPSSLVAAHSHPHSHPLHFSHTSLPDTDLLSNNSTPSVPVPFALKSGVAFGSDSGPASLPHSAAAAKGLLAPTPKHVQQPSTLKCLSPAVAINSAANLGIANPHTRSHRATSSNSNNSSRNLNTTGGLLLPIASASSPAPSAAIQSGPASSDIQVGSGSVSSAVSPFGSAPTVFDYECGDYDGNKSKISSGDATADAENGDGKGMKNEGARACPCGAGGNQSSNQSQSQSQSQNTLKRPRKDSLSRHPGSPRHLPGEADHGNDGGDGGDEVSAEGHRRRRGGLRVTATATGDGSDDARRPVKKARLSEEVDVRDGDTPSEPVSSDDGALSRREDVHTHTRSRSEPAVYMRRLRAYSRARTETPECDGSREKSPSPSPGTGTGTTSRMSFSPSPFPPARPPAPSRFHSSSSSVSTLSSGPAFPTTPPSYAYSYVSISFGSPSASGSGAGPASCGAASTGASCYFASSHNTMSGSGPSSTQPFWFEDGDLVLIVSPLSPPPSYAQAQAPATAGAYSDHATGEPPFTSAFSISNTANVKNYSHQHQQHLAPTPAPTFQPFAFRIHAARLAQASSAFASLLSLPLPATPKKEDSARAAREIAVRLCAYGARSRSRRSSMSDTVVGEGARDDNRDGDEYEVVGSCPAIRLEGDTHRDWIVALEAIYEPLSFQVRPVVFDTLASAMRIATRYGMQSLRDWAVAQLRTTWPAHVERMSPVALPNAADAIALARECDVPEILPAAFYALAVQRWRPRSRSIDAYTRSPAAASGVPLGAGTGVGVGVGVEVGRTTVLPTPHSSTDLIGGGGTDGGRAHTVLDPTDMRRLVMGREALQDVLVEIVSDPLEVGPNMAPSMPSAKDEGASGGTGVRESSYPFEDIGIAVGTGMYRPPSPSPSRSPSPKVAPIAEEPSPAFSGGTESTMGSAPVSRPTLQHHHSSSSSSSFTSSSSASSCGFPSSQSAAPMATASMGPSSCSRLQNFTFCASEPKLEPGEWRNGCRAALEKLWRARLKPDRRRAWGTWLARELYRLATLPALPPHRPPSLASGCKTAAQAANGKESACKREEKEKESVQAVGAAEGGRATPDGPGSGKEEMRLEEDIAAGVCARCWEESRRLALWRLDWLCAAIPEMFMLSSPSQS